MSTYTSYNGVIETGVVVPEGAAFQGALAFLDEDGTAYTPDANSIKLVVVDASGTIVEAESDIASDTSVSVVTDDDTNLLSAGTGKRRCAAVKWTATTTTLTESKTRCELWYDIADHVAVPEPSA